MKINRTKQRGFTLAEMAIVVVLGGILLAGGLMAGRGQISRAQAQDVIQIANDLQAASISFKQRFGYLPGDWFYTANTLPTITGGASGGATGNGLITGTLDPATGAATAGTEIELAPVQLYQAGLIGKIGPDTITTGRLKSQFGPVHMAGALANATTGASLTAYTTVNPGVQNVIIFFNLPCEVVLDVDRALDDGVDLSGKVMTDAACTAGGTAVRTFVPL